MGIADTKDLQEELYQEMRSKIKEDDSTVPLRQGPFFYYTKTLEGQQYTVHCRRAIPGGAGPGHVYEVMETGHGVPAEEVLLDENKEAKEHEFYHVGEVKVSISACQEPSLSIFLYCFSLISICKNNLCFLSSVF